MSKKIIFDDVFKNKIISYAKTEYQCKIKDVANRFGISEYSIRNNFDKEELDVLLFKGCKDSTKEKLRNANLNKTLSEETKKKISRGSKEAANKKTTEQRLAASKKCIETKTKKWGSWKDYSTYQQAKSRQTKLERYGDENYNNSIKNKQTKFERYGDENYNNAEQIKQTQFKIYGGYAFNDKEKYESTMLEKYGCRHNWASSDNRLNGRQTMYENAGSKENHYKNIILKGKETRLLLYGDEFYSNSDEAQKTMLKKYGVPYYMLTEEFRRCAVCKETRKKVSETKRLHGTFNTSKPELVVRQILEEHFGKEDVLTEYVDEIRYPFHCDFYIKSLDLFIELNLHPTHGLHPFNNDSPEDQELLRLLESNKTDWNINCINVWTQRDVEKLEFANKNKLNYIMLYPQDEYTDIINIIKERLEV